MDTMEVSVPKGIEGGQTIQVQTPLGLVSATVPAGLTAGDTFSIQLPVIQATVVQPVQPIAAIPAGFATEVVQWSQPICGCCEHKDCGLACCCALACPCVCCSYPSIEEAADVPNKLGGWRGECCLLSGLPDVALSFLGMPAVMQLVARFILRRSVIEKYSIGEDGCTTFCCVFCCAPCAMCQQTNEMFEREGLIFDGWTRARRSEAQVVLVSPAATR